MHAVQATLQWHWHPSIRAYGLFCLFIVCLFEVAVMGHLQIAKILSEGRKSLGEVMSGPALALLEAAPQDLWPRLNTLCSRAISSVGQVRYQVLKDIHNGIDAHLIVSTCVTCTEGKFGGRETKHFRDVPIKGSPHSLA